MSEDPQQKTLENRILIYGLIGMALITCGVYFALNTSQFQLSFSKTPSLNRVTSDLGAATKYQKRSKKSASSFGISEMENKLGKTQL